MKIVSLSSGSKGNCLFIRENNTSILIDAGLSFSRIKVSLESIGEDVNNLSAVLITHEHNDHTCGLPVLIKHCPRIKIYSHSVVCSFLRKYMGILVNNLEEINSPIFYINDFCVSAFVSPHDSSICLNYSVYAEDKKFSIITDCGCIKEHHFADVSDSNLLFIESNHNKDMLRLYNQYSETLKRRILSEKGHLSNDDCGKFLSQVLKVNDKIQIVLCHLSSHTNSPNVAHDEVEQIIRDEVGFECPILIAPELSMSQIFIL